MSLRPSLLRIHREDLMEGTTAALLSKRVGLLQGWDQGMAGWQGHGTAP